IRLVARNRPLSVDGFAAGVNDAAEQPFSYRYFAEASARPAFLPFAQPGVIAKDDRGDLGLVEIERQAGDPATEVEHLVQHHVAEPFDARDAIADLADRAHRLLRDRGLRAFDLRFDFKHQVRHLLYLTSARPALPASRARCRRTH